MVAAFRVTGTFCLISFLQFLYQFVQFREYFAEH